jgi:hypothetical protein
METYPRGNTSTSVNQHRNIIIREEKKKRREEGKKRRRRAEKI